MRTAPPYQRFVCWPDDDDARAADSFDIREMYISSGYNKVVESSQDLDLYREPK